MLYKVSGECRAGFIVWVEAGSKKDAVQQVRNKKIVWHNSISEHEPCSVLKSSIKAEKETP